MNNWCSMVGWCNSNWWVGSSSVIGNISNISFISISLVVNMLSTTIRESNRVRSNSVTSTITSLSGIEIRIGVVMSNCIGVGVWRRLIRVSWSSMDNWGMVGGSSMDNWSMVGGSSMVDWSMSNNTSSTMKTVGRVSYSSNRSSKSLGLSGASVFSLVWLGDRLVGNLASWTAMIASSYYWTMDSMTKMSSKELRGSRSSNKEGGKTHNDLHDVLV